MAERFSVLVTAPDPEETAEELRSDGFEVKDVDRGDGRMFAIIEADSAEDAQELAEQIAGEDCEVSEAQPYGEIAP